MGKFFGFAIGGEWRMALRFFALRGLTHRCGVTRDTLVGRAVDRFAALAMTRLGCLAGQDFGPLIWICGLFTGWLGGVDLLGAEIRWPAAFAPARCPVHAVNRLDMAARREAVWATLVAGAHWPLWYANSADVRIEDGGEDLRAGVRFRWRIFGVALDTVVQEFEPGERLAWLAAAPGLRRIMRA